ncbi:MAG: type II toxin-antitoxin system Phd/YefM family antitoxin [Chlorobiales bacterium]|nr:type II toxin-antitoxin system Phd/YefM family antitoxin [Chlorobiales bacterium]
MKYSDSIKPISYLKAHASEVIRDVSDNRETMIITHHGEAKVILQDVRIYEQTQESLALLKMLAQSSKSIEQGKYRPVSESFDLLRKQIKAQQGS